MTHLLCIRYDSPMCDKLLILDEKKVHWFPRHISELDLIANRTLVAGVDLMSEDHPGFHDEEYRARRDDLSIKAQNHRWDQPIPRIDYTQDEVAVWSAVWDKMEGLWEKVRTIRKHYQRLALQGLLFAQSHAHS